MTNLMLLLKRDYKEKISNMKSAKTSTIFSAIFSFVIIAAFLGIFIFVYYNLSQLFLNVKVNGEINILVRSKQLLSLTYMFIIFINIIFGVKNIYDKLIVSNDLQILITLPIKSREIIIYKLFKVIASQLLSSFITILPINICFMILTNQGFGFIILTLLAIILITLTSLGVSLLLLIPTYYISKFIKSNPFIMISFYSIVMVAGFVIYSIFLRALKSLITTGNIKYFFNEANTKIISKFANIFPFNNLANFTLNINGILNCLIVLVFAVCIFSIGLLLLSKIYFKFVLNNHENKTVKQRNNHTKAKKTFNSLLNKELLTILRSPEYSFQSFATCFSMPFLTFITISLISSLVYSILYINLNFEFCVFILMFYTVLINTYAQSNISRDGEMFMMYKTTPLKYKTIILSKIVFCSILSTIAILASIFTLIILGYLTIFKAILLFIIIFLFSEGSIMLSTKHDLKHFKIKNGKAESSNNTLMISLFFSLILSVLVLFLGFIAELKHLYFIGNVLSILILYVCIFAYFIICLVYLFKNLDKTISNKEEA